MSILVPIAASAKNSHTEILAIPLDPSFNVWTVGNTTDAEVRKVKEDQDYTQIVISGDTTNAILSLKSRGVFSILVYYQIYPEDKLLSTKSSIVFTYSPNHISYIYNIYLQGYHRIYVQFFLPFTDFSSKPIT